MVTTWVHGDHLLFSGQKMAKSSGNVWTLDRLEEEGHHPLDFRYLCLTSRYRRQLRFSPDALAAAGKARSRLGAHLADWGDPAPAPESPPAKEWDRRFRDAVLDDLDFPRAITVVWGLVGDDGVPPAERAALVRDWDRVLGLGLGRDDAPRRRGTAGRGGRAARGPRGRSRPPGLGRERPSPRRARADLGVEVTDTKDGQAWGRGPRRSS